MEKMVARILSRYGTAMELTTAQGTDTVKGFFQPVRSKSVQNMVCLDTPLGEVPRGQYVYMGPAEVTAGEGDTLRVGQRYYVFRRTELFYCGDQPAYLWGLCVEKGGDTSWGTES